MQFNQLRYVLEAANKKSFSAAAKSLFVSQPSLSQQIMNLEKELGIPLFIRHSKSVSLTEAGEYFVQSARRILNDTEQLKYSMLKYSSLQTGTLKLGMLWIGGYLNLPQLITDYHDRHPLVTCHLDVEGSQTLFHMLKLWKTDIWLSYQPTIRYPEGPYYLYPISLTRRLFFHRRPPLSGLILRDYLSRITSLLSYYAKPVSLIL